MRLTKVTVRDFLGLVALSVEITDDTFVIAGFNRAGKTSLQQAIRLLLCGEMSRVSLKKEWNQVIHAGKREALISVTWDGKERAAKIKASASSTSVPSDPVVPPELLDPGRLNRMNSKDRRKALFDLLGVKPEADRVRELLEKREVEKGCIDHIMPLLPAGWDSMVSSAKEKAAEARAKWAAVTGETYGSDKADGWRAVPQIPEEIKANAVRDIRELEDSVRVAQARLAEHDEKLEDMRRQIAMAGDVTCPHCGGVFQLVDAKKLAALRKALPENEAGREVLATAVETRVRDLKAGTEARDTLARLGEQALRHTAQAAAHHAEVVRWLVAETAVMPDGVPLDIMAIAVVRLNETIRRYADLHGWGVATVDPDGTCRIGGTAYPLLSKSEQWTVDAVLVAALSEISGANFVMLDEFDILDLPRRVGLIKWAKYLASQGQQVLLFGTLKAMPSFPGVWLERGEVKAA